MAYHFENIKLEKGMYGRSGRSFSQTLEEMDPVSTTGARPWRAWTPFSGSSSALTSM